MYHVYQSVFYFSATIFSILSKDSTLDSKRLNVTFMFFMFSSIIEDNPTKQRCIMHSNLLSKSLLSLLLLDDDRDGVGITFLGAHEEFSAVDVACIMLHCNLLSKSLLSLSLSIFTSLKLDVRDGVGATFLGAHELLSAVDGE